MGNQSQTNFTQAISKIHQMLNSTSDVELREDQIIEKYDLNYEDLIKRYLLCKFDSIFVQMINGIFDNLIKLE